jgi:hypothetical protein
MDEEDPPHDEADAHVAVPGKRERDLGRSLVLRFAEQHLRRSSSALRALGVDAVTLMFATRLTSGATSFSIDIGPAAQMRTAARARMRT